MSSKKIKDYLSFKRVFAIFGLTVLLFAGLLSSSRVNSQAVTVGYGSDSTLQRGMIVSLKADDANKVEPASIDNSTRLHGIVVSANDAPVTLSEEEEKNFVATIGKYETLVTNQNGDIKVGDYIAISSVNGVGTKANKTHTTVVGKATANYDSSSNVISTTEIKDITGATNNISIGRIVVDISVGANPLYQPAEVNLPGFLKTAVEAIASKPVSVTRIYVGLVVFLGAAFISGSLLYSGIRSSMISIGRNPLSKKSVTKGLLQVVISSIVVFVLGIFGVYLLLSL
jgi:hypothetical protein